MRAFIFRNRRVWSNASASTYNAAYRLPSGDRIIKPTSLYSPPVRRVNNEYTQQVYNYDVIICVTKYGDAVYKIFDGEQYAWNYWDFGLCPSSGTKQHNISETGSASVPR
jgi:hypothetical protein